MLCLTTELNLLFSYAQQTDSVDTMYLLVKHITRGTSLLGVLGNPGFAEQSDVLGNMSGLMIVRASETCKTGFRDEINKQHG
jgi:hypothetical protein